MQIRISSEILGKARYAFTTCPSTYSSFAKDPSLEEFYKSLLIKGLDIANEEVRTGKEKKSPLTIPPCLEDAVKMSEDVEILELSVDINTIHAILDYLNATGNIWPNHQPLPQDISGKLLSKGLDELGREAWQVAKNR